MSRVPSMEGGLAGGKQNGVSSAVNSSRFEKGAREERPNEPRSVPQERKEKSRLSMNGNIDSTRRAPQSKETNISVSKNDQQRAAHLVKHGLPPRPQSPRRDKQATDSKKRPLESAVNPAEKRTKLYETSFRLEAISNKGSKTTSNLLTGFEFDQKAWSELQARGPN
ncbi:hypothetical protein M7I_3502 [Glarea lozoyensis 74030]|uniref:Uncharacterized protein n=1 Tax=Glarea lozoyensis (strain ATCC 74030 / MF5533) TaxID=1104152 RepID=H0ELN5_GLAL7|nr:hypothetical protein M7I_3502 [Glarea lozoyensis 74030]